LARPAPAVGLIRGSAALEHPRVVHCRLKIRGVSHLNIHPNMFRQATHEQLGLLAGAEVIVGVAEHGVVALRVLLDRRGERQAGELHKERPLCRRPELHLAHGAEALPGRHPLVVLQGVVPCLSSPAEVIGHQPRAIRGQGALTAEKLLTLIEPVQRIDGAIERRKVQLVEAGRGVRATGWTGIRGAVGVGHGLRSGGQSWDRGEIRYRAAPPPRMQDQRRRHRGCRWPQLGPAGAVAKGPTPVPMGWRVGTPSPTTVSATVMRAN
jgi:hypothetical protein